MKRGYVYIDFEGYQDLVELRQKMQARIYELRGQGFNSEQILRIVFDDSHFRDCFISIHLYRNLRTEFINANKI